MTAQIIQLPGTQSQVISNVERIAGTVGDLLSLLGEASTDELGLAVTMFLDSASLMRKQQLPIYRSKKKVDRREHARLRVIEEAFTDAAFLIRRELEHREI